MEVFNIAMGTTSGRRVVLGMWWYSPGHHENMIRDSFRSVGLALDGRYWTQQFGR